MYNLAGGGTHQNNQTTHYGASCPWGELSVGRVVLGASCPWGELSVRRVDVGRVVLGRVVVGQVSMGRVVQEPQE